QRGAPRVADSQVNTPVLLFALGVSLLTGLLFGLAPALQSGSARLVSALKEGGRGTSGGASLQRTRAALTVAEVALAVVLLAGAAVVAAVGGRGAKKFFAGARPIGEGRRLGGGGQVNNTSSWRTIVGVVRDTRTDGLAEAPRGTLYLPRAQEKMRGGFVIVRSTRPAEQMTAQLRRALAEVDPDVPLERVQTMDAALAV